MTSSGKTSDSFLGAWRAFYLGAFDQVQGSQLFVCFYWVSGWRIF